MHTDTAAAGQGTGSVASELLHRARRLNPDERRYLIEGLATSLAVGIDEERQRHEQHKRLATGGKDPYAGAESGAVLGLEGNAVRPSHVLQWIARETEEVTLDNIDDAMRYQPWQSDQVDAGDIVRESLTAAAKAILRAVPRSPLRTRCLNGILDLRMLANQAITFRGRF